MHRRFKTHSQLFSSGKCGMYFVEDNASDTVESSVSNGLNLHLYESRQIPTCISLI